jgi:photosystem II stability/assembly factor-like uncharacterized protein
LGSDEGSQEPGYVRLDVSLERQAGILMKSAAADSTFNLDSMYVVLTAPGSATQSYRYAIAGRPDTGAITVAPYVYGLNPVRTWTAKIYTIDNQASPARRDTVHFDSIPFYVNAGDTVDVSAVVRAAVAILRVRMLSTTGDSLLASISYLRVRINGVTRDSLFPNGATYNGVYLANLATAWAVSDSGWIYKTSDSGTTWIPQSSGIPNDLNSVWFTSTSNGCIVGDAGAILRTTNGGTNWISKASGVTTNLRYVNFATAAKGYAVGDEGVILKTLDGGNTWESISGGWFSQTSPNSQNLNATHFTSASEGYAVGAAGTILRTANSGATWTAQNSGTTNVLLGVHAYSSTNAVAVGAGGVIRRTTNAGSSTWSTISSGVTTELRDVHFATATYGWAVGAGGVIRRSGNGGSSWTAQTSGITTDLNAVASNGTDRVLAVGSNGEVRRRNSISNTSAFTDASNAVTGSVQLNGVHMLSGTSTAWVVGNGGFIAKSTSTNNNDWTAQTSGTTENLLDVYFANANDGWVTGANGTILRTTNGGTDWAPQTSGTAVALHGLYAANADSVFAVGDGGTVLKTRTSGALVTTANLRGGHFLGDTGFVVGESGTSLRTYNGGSTWTSITGTAQNLNGVAWSKQTGAAGYVTAVGDGGTLVQATLAGNSWTSHNSGTTQRLNAIHIAGAPRLYLVGDSGIVRSKSLQTAGGGIAFPLNNPVWAVQSTKTTESLRAVNCFPQQDTCLFAGTNETVVKTEDGASAVYVHKSAGARRFDKELVYKALPTRKPTIVILQAIDRNSPLRGFEFVDTLTFGAGQDTTINVRLKQCGGTKPACTP